MIFWKLHFLVYTLKAVTEMHLFPYKQKLFWLLTVFLDLWSDKKLSVWNCQSGVNKADFITSITGHSRLNLMALTETWIKPEDNATPAALSNNFSFSHTVWLEEVEVLVWSSLIIGNLLLYHLWVSTAPLNHIQLLLPTL